MDPIAGIKTTSGQKSKMATDSPSACTRTLRATRHTEHDTLCATVCTRIICPYLHDWAKVVKNQYPSYMKWKPDVG